MDSITDPTTKKTRSREWKMFLFITIFLFPILSVIFVGGYGFTVWMLQLFVFGPPGHGG
ncbi:trimethylamine N-oxide reductase system protein TorE [Photobacterium phosphoreum]|jgi:nitrate reductase NapE|uniref:Trimethylamine N-oxide reductase system protein TorE n=1 Tax=Photobacterium phosphoreum TaxID=659 RepID=A0A2T3K4P6_PHOPO|nr:trimethylamine N-oxide reductase system protein TorE [Photobacterium phosphoreum]MCD9462885.1 trimethylamine N-oxide reductase system protein TorE [Photobacterium phosphoreum]MCD9470162.1 trimethylamine N-oxide reductase system protein TorE [Photobacterium phosphoreum]MCD9475945.1 trimethylamine N-oxide reductase system protein TorE [Photobacterium phosphoreum]MCD9480649.1 trimethylamine N-oxide reductase system protein TorE [Photobacterium phosphoreum]MCD9485155.1 trimethylamine N-oxide re